MAKRWRIYLTIKNFYFYCNSWDIREQVHNLYYNNSFMFKVRQLIDKKMWPFNIKKQTEKTNENYSFEHNQSHWNMADYYSKYFL